MKKLYLYTTSVRQDVGMYIFYIQWEMDGVITAPRPMFMSMSTWKFIRESLIDANKDATIEEVSVDVSHQSLESARIQHLNNKP